MIAEGSDMPVDIANQAHLISAMSFASAEIIPVIPFATPSHGPAIPAIAWM